MSKGKLIDLIKSAIGEGVDGFYNYHGLEIGEVYEEEFDKDKSADAVLRTIKDNKLIFDQYLKTLEDENQDR